MPTLSFVATFYNKARYVPIVLDAIAGQRNVGDVEYVFVDDGSTDDTLALLRSGTRDWPNVMIIAQENAGPARATNTAILAASGDFIKLWDGDDIGHPDLTRSLLDALQAHNADVAFCGIDYSVLTEDAYFADKDAVYAAMTVDGCSHVVADPVSFVLKGPFANPTALLFKAATLRQSGGADPDVFIQDYALSVRAAHRARFVQVPRTLAFAFRDVSHRLSDNEAQILHDLNAVLHNYAAHTVLSNAHRRYLGQRMTGRAWKWDKRHNRAGYASGSFWRFVKSRLWPWAVSQSDLAKSLLPFRHNRALRGVHHDLSSGSVRKRWRLSCR